MSELVFNLFFYYTVYNLYIKLKYFIKILKIHVMNFDYETKYENLLILLIK